MEKKFEQLDHFEKVKTYARQGYGGMTITVKGGTSKADQQEAWYQARKKFSDIKLELPEGVIGPIFNDEYGDVTGLLYAVKGDGVSHAELSDTAEDIKRRLLKVPMVKKVDIYGKQAKKVYVEFSHERLAALGITPLQIAESLRSQNSVLASGSIDTRGDRVLVRVSGQFTSLDDIRNVPIAAGGRADQARRLHDDHARLRRSADLHRAPQRAAGADARHHDDQRRQHRRPRQGDREAPSPRCRRELPYGVELERVADQPTVVSESIWEFERSLLEALAIVLAVSLFSLGWRTGIVVGLSVPIVLGVVAAGDARDGLEPRARLARVADHRARPAGGRRHHRGRDDGREDGGRVGSPQGGRLFLRRDRDAAADRRAHHRRRLHADRILEVDHRRVRGRHFLDRRHGRAVLVGRLRDDHALPRREDAAEGLRQASPRRRPATTRRSTASCAAGSTSPSSGAGGSSAPPWPHWPSRLPECKFVPQQFFPNSSRPELVVELRLKEGASFAATTEQVKKMEAVAREGRGRPLLHRVHGRRPAALLSLAQSGAAEPRLRRLHRHDDATWRRANACARA